MKKYFILLLSVLFIIICTTSIQATISKYKSSGDSSGNSGDIVPGGEQKKQPKEAVVVVDAGHGGSDLGTYYGSMYEKNINLDISLRLGNLLKEIGLKVVYTREKDVFVGLKERAELANSLGAALFISVHNNQMPDSPDYRGTETLYCPPENTETGEMDGEKLATLVQNELVKTLKTVNNGIIYRPNLAVLHRTKMPAVIAEIAYISNRSDREKLSSPDFRQKAAQALANAVLKALDVMGAKQEPDGRWMIEGK